MQDFKLEPADKYFIYNKGIITSEKIKILTNLYVSVFVSVVKLPLAVGFNINLLSDKEAVMFGNPSCCLTPMAGVVFSREPRKKSPRKSGNSKVVEPLPSPKVVPMAANKSS